MSTATLDRPSLHPKSTLSSIPKLIAPFTLAAASLVNPLVSNESPTYISSPSELINLFFTPEQQNIHSQQLILQKLKHAIRTYSTYEKNWDGYGGIPPKDETIKDTINFLKYLPEDISLPYAGLSGDGEINLFWGKNGTFIDIGFTGEAAARVKGAINFGIDDNVLLGCRDGLSKVAVLI